MKRGKKLIALLAVFAVALGAALAVKKWNPQDNTNTTGRDYDTEVFALDPEKVTNFSWEYSQEAAFTKTNGVWSYDADEAFPVDGDCLEEMLTALSSVRASRTIENAQDLDQYGLEYPFCTIRVTVEGKTYQLALGNQNTISGDRYFTNGDGNVYMVANSLASYFNFGAEGAMALEQIPDMSEITGLKLQSDTNSYEMLYQAKSDADQTDSYQWVMGDKVLDTQLTQNLLNTVKTIKWNSCVNYNTTDFAAYGLEIPRATLTATYGDKTFVLQLGDETEKGVYAHIPDSKMVYLINTSTAKSLLEATYSSLAPETK